MMASETTKRHPWHLVEPSPWPAVGTVAALCMALSREDMAAAKIPVITSPEMPFGRACMM